MTDQHPLTDEIMYELHGDKRGYSNPFDADDMRAAADWQLEQVIAWLEDSLEDHRYSGIGILVDWVIEDLREAMRPTTQENN